MKTIKRLSLVFALVVAATFSSCGGDDDAAPAPSPVPATGTFINATADGAPFTTVFMGVSTASAQKFTSGGVTTMAISGSNFNTTNPMNTQTIVLSLVGVTGTGPVAISQNSVSNLSYVPAAGTVGTAFNTMGCSGTSGTVNITSFSATKVEGTFSFTGKNDGCTASKTVTNGSFRAEFN